ncbi:hypothetical protein Unana1_02986 [Umbelopsis nana]
MSADSREESSHENGSPCENRSIDKDKDNTENESTSHHSHNVPEVGVLRKSRAFLQRILGYSGIALDSWADHTKELEEDDEYDEEENIALVEEFGSASDHERVDSDHEPGDSDHGRSASDRQRSTSEHVYIANENERNINEQQSINNEQDAINHENQEVTENGKGHRTVTKSGISKGKKRQTSTELDLDELNALKQLTSSYLAPIKKKYRVGKALNKDKTLLSRLQNRIKDEGRGKQKATSSEDGAQPGDDLLPDNGMSKVLEDDLRAHHFTLKALKEQLEAKLKRLKADEDLLLYMAGLSETDDLQGVQPLVRDDQTSKRRLSLDERNDDEEWNTLYKKLRTSESQEVGDSSLQRQYVADTFGDTATTYTVSDEESLEEDIDEIEDEDAAMKALNHMLTEFAADEF